MVAQPDFLTWEKVCSALTKINAPGFVLFPEDLSLPPLLLRSVEGVRC